MSACSSRPSRLVVLAVAGMATLALTACGSSDKSDGAARSGSGSTAGQPFTAAQLDQAMKATTIDGQSPIVSDQSMVKESLSGAEKMRDEVTKSLKISPAECEKMYSMAQLMNDGSASTPASLGSLNAGKTALVAMQLPAHTRDAWDASAFEKCHEFTMSGTVLGMTVSGKATASLVDVPATVAANPHGITEVVTQDGKPTTMTAGLARVGDVEIEVLHSDGAASGEQLAKELDALATQVQKLA